MEPTKSNTIARQPADTALMPPPPKRIKRPKNVIDEETYTEAISQIIARDFFPGLFESETQQEYLDALDSQDPMWISSASRRLQQVMTPGRRKGRRGTSYQTTSQASETPRDFIGDTPNSMISQTTTSTQAAKGPEVDTNMSLDTFQSRYTSEDNESFYKLLDAQNSKRAEKYAWMWSGNNKLPSKMMLKQKEIETKLLQAQGAVEEDGGKKDRLAIRDASAKPGRPDAWKSKPDNGLMFAPSSVEDSITTVAQRAQADSRAASKGVAYSNTRLQPVLVLHNPPITPSSPSLSAVQDAISGRRRAADIESGFGGSETPRVNGYAFVDDEPELEPYISTPDIDLGNGESVRNPFLIKEQSCRENLHHRMVDKNAKSKRVSMKNGLTGKAPLRPVPKFPSSPRVSSDQLTPAAMRLWSRVGGVGNKTPDAFGSQTPHTAKTKSSSRTSWTPATK